MNGVWVALALVVSACARSIAPPAAPTHAPRVEDRYSNYPALTAVGTKEYGAPTAVSQARPLAIGQWAAYKLKSADGVELELLRVVAAESCGFWIERTLYQRRRASSWTFCVLRPASLDEPNPHESLMAVVERRGRYVISAEDFRVGSADRTRFAWLVGLLQAPSPERTDLTREDAATPVGVFRCATKFTTTQRDVEVTRWSYPAVPLGGIVKEVTRDHTRVLVAFGATSHESPIVSAFAELQETQFRAAPRKKRAVESSDSDASPGMFFVTGLGLGGVSRVGDIAPTVGASLRIQFGQRLRQRLHLVEEFNLIGFDDVVYTPTLKAEAHSSFGVGVRWLPFGPKPPNPQVSAGSKSWDGAPHEFYLVAVLGANARDRWTLNASSEVSEDTAWSPMASVAIGWFGLQRRGWSLGPEFREQITRYDGHIQRGWQLSWTIHLNQW